MSPIAIPFDNIAHSQQPLQKKKPIFRPSKGRTIEGVRYTVKRTEQPMNVQFRPFHLMHAASSTYLLRLSATALPPTQQKTQRRAASYSRKRDMRAQYDQGRI